MTTTERAQRVCPSKHHFTQWSNTAELLWKRSLGQYSTRTCANIINLALRLFNRVELSDITFLIHGKPLPVHRFVVCIQSRYFENAFRNFAESETKTMTLNAATEAAYWRVFKYLYTGDYPDDLADLTSEGTRSACDKLRSCRLTLSG